MGLHQVVGESGCQQSEASQERRPLVPVCPHANVSSSHRPLVATSPSVCGAFLPTGSWAGDQKRPIRKRSAGCPARHPWLNPGL